MTKDFGSTEPNTDPAVVRSAVAAATAAATPWRRTPAGDRAAALRRVADRLDLAAPELIPLAMTESHLPLARLTSELARTTFQLRLFAEVLNEGSFADAIIDTHDPDHPLGPRPDLRRIQRPVGPVAVYAASNFPFAFSVAGGDTAAALAAGCPVVVKAHPGHPQLSARIGDLVSQALTQGGAAAGLLTVVHGIQAGIDLLRDDRIEAAAFTGSVHGGLTLAAIAAARERPIPFYGELGSINPVVVTTAAAAARGADIVSGFVNSFTLGVGQFCTKPGLLFLPVGHGLTDALISAVQDVGAAPMLNHRISEQHHRSVDSLRNAPGVSTLVAGHGDQLAWSPTLLTATGEVIRRDPDRALAECFGPTAVIVEYTDLPELAALLELVPGSLTATVHAQPQEASGLSELIDQLSGCAGRVLFNGWPTGVAVSWAQHHGGPYPATTVPSHTSVGASSIRRFQRPVCYQSMPQQLLPAELHDRNEQKIPRRINGRLTTGDVSDAVLLP